jgi:hypothetical protein
MKMLDLLLRKWSPKRYCYRKLKQSKNAHIERLKAARSWPRDKQQELENDLYWEERQWNEWIPEIEDAELVATALKREVYLDEIPPSPSEDDHERPGHYTQTGFGCRLLLPDTRTALVKKVRERTPAFHKERRDRMELYTKLVTAIAGLLGAGTGLVLAFLK